MIEFKGLTPKQYIWGLHKAAQKAAKTYQRFESECKELTLLKMAFKVTHPEDFAEYEKLTKGDVVYENQKIEQLADHNKNGFIETTQGQEVRSGETANESAVVNSTDGNGQSNDVRGD